MRVLPVVSCFCAAAACAASQSTFTPTAVVKDALTAMLTTTSSTEVVRVIQTYFSPSYTQYTNTVFYDYQNFTAFMQATKEGLQSVDFQIFDMTGYDDAVPYGNNTVFQVGVFENIFQTYTNYTLNATGIEVIGVQNGRIVQNHESINLVES